MFYKPQLWLLIDRQLGIILETQKREREREQLWAIQGQFPLPFYLNEFVLSVTASISATHLFLVLVAYICVQCCSVISNSSLSSMPTTAPTAPLLHPAFLPPLGALGVHLWLMALPGAFDSFVYCVCCLWTLCSFCLLLPHAMGYSVRTVLNDWPRKKCAITLHWHAVYP